MNFEQYLNALLAGNQPLNAASRGAAIGAAMGEARPYSFISQPLLNFGVLDGYRKGHEAAFDAGGVPRQIALQDEIIWKKAMDDYYANNPNKKVFMRNDGPR